MPEEAAEPAQPSHVVAVAIRLNGRRIEAEVEARTNLLDFVRQQGLTGTHAGCEHGVCGACTLLVDRRPVRACLMLAAQADGRSVETVESLGDAHGPDPLQRSFSQSRALQCGFCTPGFLMLARGFLEENPEASEEEIRDALSANLCRCTGYAAIVSAVLEVARRGV